MSTARHPFLLAAQRCALYATLVLVVGGAMAQPAQSPLLSRSGGGVAPNVVLNLDDSGSMMYQHMPENSFVLGGKTINLGGDQSVISHPSDTRSFTNIRGTYPANISATGSALNYQQMVRSPDVNSLYYNPETTYLPWIKSDGSRFPPANLAGVAVDPLTAESIGGITFVNAGAVETGTNGNINPDLPANIRQNDFLICLVESFDAITHTAPAGWARIYNLQATTHSASAFYKIAGFTEASPIFGHTGGSGYASICYAYRNVDTANPFDVDYAASAGTTNTLTTLNTTVTGTVTTPSAGSLMLLATHQASVANSLNVTVTGGLTWTAAGIGRRNNTGSPAFVGLHHALKATAGSVGPVTTTSNSAGRSSGVLLALKRSSLAAVNGINLLAPTSNITANWCFDATSGCASSSRSFTPMLFYRLKKSGTTFFDPTLTSSYDSYDLTNNLKNGSGSAAPQTYANRDDCTANVCSLSDERQNFANWYVYHRSRLLVAQGAVAESFWNISADKLRVGWGSIHKGYTTLDNNENTATVVAGVRNFSTARKDALFSFVRNIDVESGTPLQSALYGVGEYYTRASPWADDPGNANATGSTPKDCRRAYHLLITDGLWNTTGAPFTVPSVGNYDGAKPSGGYPNITTTGNEYQYKAEPPYADSSSNTLADYASYFFNRDLRSTLNNNVQPSPPGKLFWQGMVNFTVGIGLKGDLDPAKDLPFLSNPTGTGGKNWGTNKVDDLWHTAVNSEGRFFTANNSTELAGALTSALTATTQNELREAGVATSSSVLEDGNRKYVPFYKSGVWTGDIRAFELDGNGLTKVGPGPEGELWSAGGKVPAWNLRNIFTWSRVSSSPVQFNWSTINTTERLVIDPLATNSDLVDYLRGKTTKEVTTAEPTNPYRARAGSRLGDFINSNPVLVKGGTDLGYQGLTLGGTSYNTFRSTVKNPRTGVLFVGANDGMLHAFKDTQNAVPADDGKEIFAYVPRAVYPNLSILSDPTYGDAGANYHRFFVDGALSETDAFVKATSAAPAATWRNYLMGSLGAGGRAVFALDVTDMTSPGATNIKWEFSDANDTDLGFVSAPIVTGVLPDGEWVAIFGNGPFSTAGKSVLFVLNLETGVSRKLVVDGLSSDSGLGGVGVVRDASGYITNLYAGDLKGNLWKFEYSASAPGTSKFQVSGGTKLFTAQTTASVAQPITQAPVIYDHTLGGKLVVFGTGKLLTEADRDTIGTQSMYAIWDKPGDTVARPIPRTSIEPRTITKVPGKDGAIFYGLSGNGVDWNGSQRGWVIDLALNDAGVNLLEGQRVIYPPQRVSSKLALLSTVAPAEQTSVCTSATGLGANFVIPVEPGLNPTYKLFDVNGDGVISSADAFVVGYATNVDGIDSVISDQGANAGGGGGVCPAGFIRTSIQSTTGQVMACVEQDVDPTTGGGTVMKDRIWRRIMNPPIQ